MKIRPTNSFRQAINDARSTFGVEDNNTSQICRRALRAWSDNKFDMVYTHDKTIGNPITIKCETTLENKDFFAVVIGYVQWQIEKNASRRQKPLELDNCENYIIEEV